MGTWSLPAMAAAVWAGTLLSHALGAGRGVGRAGLLFALGTAGMGLWLILSRPGPSEGSAVGAIRRGVAGAVLLVSFAGLGAGWAGLREIRVARSPLADLAGRAVRVEGSVHDLPRPGELGWTATVDVALVWPRGGSARTGLKLSEPLWAEGDGPAPS